MTRKNGSPWRSVFEETAKAAHGRRDEVATIGSINWLRHAMEQRGANPNVVRNIIYRDKGRLHDKRELYLILEDLRRDLGLPPIADPELTQLGTPFAAAELEVDQVLGREQRRVYRSMVGGIRAGGHPKLIVTGRTGSGKTMLADYIQQALELHQEQGLRVYRAHFPSAELDAAFVRLAAELGMPAGLMESRLVRVGSAGPFAVQADAQAETVRLVMEHLRADPGPKVLILHLSQGLGSPGRLGSQPLRLNTPDVPRVSAAEWLWKTLLRPLASLPRTSIYVSAVEVPAVAGEAAAPYEGPLRLTAPTSAEAKRFVAAHGPELAEEVKDAIVARAGRSYEELRTLTLLTLVRQHAPAEDAGTEQALERLSALVEPGADPRVRAFLTALTALSSGEEQELSGDDLAEVARALAPAEARKGLSQFELSFLDPLPNRPGSYRTFSRRLLRLVEERLAASDPGLLRDAHAAAADLTATGAAAEPTSRAAHRHLHHLLAARRWRELVAWCETRPAPYTVLTRSWDAARRELEGDDLEAFALAFARQMLRLGAFEHVETVRACELLARSAEPLRRAWTAVMRAQAEVSAGRFERAEVLLVSSEEGVDDPLLAAERDLTAASVMRWRGELERAAELVAHVASSEAARSAPPGSLAERALRTNSAVWAGLIAKDSGDLTGSLGQLWAEGTGGDLLGARLAFQRGDVALRLGLLDTAQRELDHALEAAATYGALPRERARFAARRGTLARQLGDLAGAAEWFDLARALTEEGPGDKLDVAFGLARVEDEAAMAALAAGDHEAAIVSVTTAIATFKEYQQRRDVDASFRIARAEVHLATAYALRGLNVPLRRPLPLLAAERGSADLDHALSTLTDVIKTVTDPRRRQPAGASALRGLVREARLMAAYITPDPERALALADEAVAAARFDYQLSNAHAAKAIALIRSGRFEEALEAVAAGEAALARSTRVLSNAVEGAPAESGDLGLRTQHAVLRAVAHLRAGDQDQAAEAVVQALSDPRLAPFHEGVLRVFGEAAELEADQSWKRHRPLRAVLGISGTGPTTPARLPDALVAAWRTRNAAPLPAGR